MTLGRAPRRGRWLGDRFSFTSAAVAWPLWWPPDDADPLRGAVAPGWSGRSAILSPQHVQGPFARLQVSPRRQLLAPRLAFLRAPVVKASAHPRSQPGGVFPYLPAAIPPDSVGNGRAGPAQTMLRTALSSGCSQNLVLSAVWARSPRSTTRSTFYLALPALTLTVEPS